MRQRNKHGDLRERQVTERESEYSERDNEQEESRE